MIPALDLEVKLSRGETIHTENSYKFTHAKLESMMQKAGFRPSQEWTDDKGWFGVYLAVAE
jgi:uncharacterized SAM-dependent methyltransferase